MFLCILHRTILWELFRVFLLSLLGITGILLMAGIVAEASRHGLGPGQILAMIPLIIPSTLPYTLPATTLFATCVVYGRLAHDNEILAIKAAGVNVLKIVWPGIFLGLLMSGITVGLYFDVIPTTRYQLRAQVLADVEEYLYSMLRQDGWIRHPKLDYEMYVKRVQGRKLLDAEFRRRNRQTNQYDVIARAASAELKVDMHHKQLSVKMWQCWISSADPSITEGFVTYQDWPIELPKELLQQDKIRASDMTWLEMLDAEKARQADVDRIDAEIATAASLIALKKPLDDLPRHLGNLRAARHQKSLERLHVEVEMHWRVSVAVGCLCFVLVGCPVGVWFSRSDYLSAFITCFLPIVVVYYPLLLCGNNLAKSGKYPLLACLWIANGLMFLTALPLYRRLLRH